MAELYHYRITPVRVIDGDTADLIVDLGFYIKMERRARLLGINTPEIFGGHYKTQLERTLGLECKSRLEVLLKGQALVARTKLDSSDKYGRILVDIIADGKSINEVLKIEADAAWAKLKAAHPTVYTK